MIRKLLMTTAISLVATSGAMAAGNEANSAMPMTEEYMQDLGQAALASNLIGESVYASEAPDAEMVGDINDLVVSEDGTVQAVVIGVGGFLGVGEKNVAVNFSNIRWAHDENGDAFVVFEASRESLQAAPEFNPEETAMTPREGVDETAMTPGEGVDATAMAPAEERVDETAMAPAEQPMENTGNTAITTDQTAATDQTAQPELTEVMAGSVSADRLLGATVYASNEENVGEISDVRLNADGGSVDAVIVDVGGFLGMGAKPVALAFENLTFKTEGDESTFYVYTDFTREELEAAPDYDEAAYDTERDSMRLTQQ